ncbi:MAG: SPOR domain-containing protein [Desulfovibrionaceae bacterium]|nr:SPOR domain-containing protein [Desulfovibrionaceae bacterium]
MPDYRVKIPKEKAPPKTYTFILSLPGLISAGGGLVLALTVFFILGILIGRGYRPEADVPELARIMPVQEFGNLTSEAPVEVLRPEDLQYPERLSQTPAQAAAKAAADKAEVQAKAQPKVQAKAGEQAAAPGGRAYDYVYQAASFRKLDMAEDLRQKISAVGLKTRIDTSQVSGTTWHRVMVLFRGTPEQTGGMKEKLSAFNIKKPLLREKTPVKD